MKAPIEAGLQPNPFSWRGEHPKRSEWSLGLGLHPLCRSGAAGTRRAYPLPQFGTVNPGTGASIGRASSPEQPDLDPSTPTGGVRLRRRLDLIIAAVRGLYTVDRPILITLACRAATNPPARAASAAALRGLSPLSQLLPTWLTACLVQVAASPGVSVVWKKSIKGND